jgi:hypothetical protein
LFIILALSVRTHPKILPCLFIDVGKKGASHRSLFFLLLLPHKKDKKQHFQSYTSSRLKNGAPNRGVSAIKIR